MRSTSSQPTSSALPPERARQGLRLFAGFAGVHSDGQGSLMHA
eukprot:CAMPEP_0204522564 /NCGR_PEP_ID=MMETSP0661-20131031/6395_1 /ASSEMBLY_ACC=CAM_ASM_000606 /TAXON_ID=109239 /ORGANISM="Alexandrium margalefi, Strain AMGDE01CS-322" /LENGTH=42 /DNA_ID= /DNA_START= /DNA_END= /DNA_ORIENTATION=